MLYESDETRGNFTFPLYKKVSNSTPISQFVFCSSSKTGIVGRGLSVRMIVRYFRRRIFHINKAYSWVDDAGTEMLGICVQLRKGVKFFKRDVLSSLCSGEKFADLRFVALHMGIWRFMD